MGAAIVSLDIWAEVDPCDQCGRGADTVFSFNYTHNVAPMWRLAGCYAALYESAGWGSKGPHKPFDGAPVLPGFYEIPTERERIHITQKPVALMMDLVRLAPPGGLVVDTFAGSGSTGIAAIRNGRRVLLIESNASIASSLRERMEAEEKGSTIVAQRAGQEVLFG